MFPRTIANRLGAQPRRVRPGARFGQRERGDDLTGGHALKPSGFLFVGAEPDQDLAGDPVVGSEHRTQCQRGVAQLHGQLDVLCHVQAEPAPLLRNRVSEKPHLLGLVADVVGNAVVRHDLLLARDHGGSDEVASLGQDVREILIAHDFIGCSSPERLTGVGGHESRLLLRGRRHDGKIIYEI